MITYGIVSTLFDKMQRYNQRGLTHSSSFFCSATPISSNVLGPFPAFVGAGAGLGVGTGAGLGGAGVVI